MLVRVGARFACSGDGLCCTDLHALGPVSRKETKRLRVIQPGSVIKHQSLKIHMIDTVSHPGGGEGCTFLRPHGCGIYSERPHTCHHFPYNLTSTPLGLRVSTDHRCPCRTLGPRPALDPEAARSSLSDALGRLLPDVRVGATIPLRPRYNIAFARYQDEVENPLLRALLDGDDPLAALATAPFAPLKSSSWGDVAHLLRGYADGTTGGEAVALFGDALLTLQGQNTRAKRTRKWAWAFDNAEARGGEPEPAHRVLGDWIADVIWSMRWRDQGSFERALRELSTRLTVATRLTERLIETLALRPDRAAAEAVMAAEIVGAIPLWPDVVASIKA